MGTRASEREERGERLLSHHQALITASGIAPEVAAARGYRSVTRKCELRELGFAEAQCRVPALLIPLWSVWGEIAGYQVRPDLPRCLREGRTAKYETPQGMTMCLDVPPGARGFLGDPHVPLVITEGARKADAAVSRGLCAVALLGVWNWRGTNAEGGRTALADWEGIALKGRRVYLAFDSDVMQKAPVHQALGRLKALLEARGAAVRVILLPPGPGGAKVGLDDYLAAGHPVAALLALATERLPPLPACDAPALPYRETPEGLVWLRPSEGSAVTPLTNFRARIVAELTRDDGMEAETEFEMEATLGGRAFRFRIPARQFAGMGWVIERLGAQASIYPGPMRREHTRFAIQQLSTPVRRTVYAHTGWRRIDGRWLYLHAGGALGAAGPVAGIEVDLPRELSRYCLPEPPGRAEAAAAVARSLAFREIVPPAQGWPWLALLATAVLGEVLPLTFSAWIHGASGARKSTVSLLALNHLGEFGDFKDLPANFLSTGNALEQVLFAAKDTVVVVDDYCPQTDPRAAQQQEATATRLIRAAGNSQGRNRLTADARLRGEKPPRALVVVTAELPPPGGQSSAARTLEVEWLPESVDLARLTRAQAADTAAYRTAFAAYLQWLAPQMESLRAELASRLAPVRARLEASGVGHGRVAETAARLCVGIDRYLRFAEAVAAIAPAERERLMAEACAALCQLARRTGQSQADRRPTALFRDYLRALFLQKLVYVTQRDGAPPAADPERWGYRLDDEGRPTTRPHADLIGWLDAAEGLLYLLPSAAWKALSRFARESGTTFPGNQRTLGEALDRDGLLAARNPGRRDCSVRVQSPTGEEPAGSASSMRCWALRVADVMADAGLPGMDEEELPADPSVASVASVASFHTPPPSSGRACAPVSQKGQARAGEGKGGPLRTGDTGDTGDRVSESLFFVPGGVPWEPYGRCQSPEPTGHSGDNSRSARG